MKGRSNRQSIFRKTAAGTVLALIIAACGGGGGGAPQDPIGGIDAGGAAVRFFASGPISGFGSIILGGIEYDTSQAQIIIDGAEGTESQLAVGQLITISGSLDGATRTAEHIEFDDNVEGPIDSINLTSNMLVALGQTVIVTNGTSFDDSISPNSLAGLDVGDIIEVSGNFNSDGSIVATRIELKAPGGVFEVTGIISSHDGTTMKFSINDLVVDYSTATLEDFPSGQPAVGDLVEAKGSQISANDELIASNVEFKGNDLDDRIDDQTQIEIEGLITRFGSVTDFDVGGFTVTTDNQTEYRGGTANDLAENVRVEVHGQRDEQGRLLADEVEFEDEGNVEIDALVDSVDASANQVVMLGITVELSATTRIEDKLSPPMQPFSIDDINPGEWLEIRGTESAPGTVAATRVERDEPDDEARIRGTATNVMDPSFQILGLDIDTDGNTQFTAVTRAEFFATAEGRLAQADGNLNGARFLATQVEFEDIN
jgi:hypothetical protein